MRRRTPIFQAADDALVSSGLQPDRHTLKRLLWESASNVIFARGKVLRKKAPALAFDNGNNDPIRGLSQQQAENGGRWIWAGANRRITRWSTGAPELIDAAFSTYQADATVLARPTIYDFTHYGDWTIVNSGVGAAYIYKPSVPSWGVFAAGEAPENVTQFLKKMNFLIAAGYGARGTRVGWSDADNIELWTADADNLAGSISVEELDTPIRAASKLGDAISVFAEDQMGLIRYIGQPYIFGQKTVLDGIGAVGKAAVASDTRVNVGIGRAGVWWTDGNSSRYIDEGFLTDYLQDQVNWDQAAKCVAKRNDYTGCFEFHFPMLGSNIINEGWAWDPSTGGWSQVPFISAGDERRLFGYPLIGTNGGDVQLGDFDTTTLGALSLVSKPLIMSGSSGPHAVVRIDEVDLLLHKASEIEFRLGCSDEPNGDYEYTDFLPAVAGNKLYEVPGELPENPYWKIEFRSTPDENDTWDIDLQGFLLYGVEVGTKA